MIALTLLFSALALAQDCAPRDFRADLGPVRNQDDLSWCYAYSSADLISQRIGKKVSATDLASTFVMGDSKKLLEHPNAEVRAYLNAHPDFAELIRLSRKDDAQDYGPDTMLTKKGMKGAGGTEDVTILMANTKGYCPEENFPSREKNQDRFVKTIHNLLRKRLASDALGFCMDLPVQNDPTSSILDPVSVAVAKLYEKELDKKCARRPYPVPLIPVVKKFAESLPEYHKKISRGEVSRTVSERELFESLNSALDQGRVAAIGYSANAIMKPDPDDNDEHSDHSSVVAGRKKINGVCHYLVRNTWGSDCSLYLDKFVRSKRCEKGSIWVTPDELKETLYSVMHLK